MPLRRHHPLVARALHSQSRPFLLRYIPILLAALIAGCSNSNSNGGGGDGNNTDRDGLLGGSSSGCTLSRDTDNPSFRCTYSSSQLPTTILRTQPLDDTSMVLIEAWGAVGGSYRADVITKSNCSAKQGPSGYAFSAFTFGDLNTYIDESDLYLYVAEESETADVNGQNESVAGGSASLVIGQAITDIGSMIPADNKVVVIAGGGGQAGVPIYDESSDKDVPISECIAYYDGGAGGVADASTSSDVVGRGEGQQEGSAQSTHTYSSGGGGSNPAFANVPFVPGSAGFPGLNGQNGTTGNEGTEGIGGAGGFIGSADYTPWQGSTLKVEDWLHGQGGNTSLDGDLSIAGAGGGGYGGGGSGININYEGAKVGSNSGGGGGSWARQSSTALDTADIDPLGQDAYDGAAGQIVISVESPTLCEIDPASTPTYARCTYTVSSSIDYATQVTLFNQVLPTAQQIDNDTQVYLEAWGGSGGKGGNGGGDGGAGGYAFTAQTLGVITSLTNNQGSDSLAIYIGDAGSAGGGVQNGGNGAAATLVLSSAITDISDPTNPGGENVFLIAGGGGAGGGGNGGDAGGIGGAGGQAIATVSDNGAGAGDAGSAISTGSSGAGQGGSGGTKGCAGTSAQAQDCGTDGIGGLGGQGGSGQIAAWVGSTVNDSEWPNGQGGISADKVGGSGGGGFGGGGTGILDSSTLVGDGGGGGASYSRIVTSSIVVDSTKLLTENPFSDGAGAVVITFDLAE